MRGKIIKGIGGFYYIWSRGSIYECRAKGIFRKDGVRPLVGDDVELLVLDEDKKLGNIEEILPRRNELIRPALANIDQALVVFALARPRPNLRLLDLFLVSMQRQSLPAVLCFNKQDAVTKEERGQLREIYKGCGCTLLFTSALNKEGIADVQDVLRGKTTALAGPSGVGKSSLVNLLAPSARMETGAVSRKTDRGRHTTRHSELLQAGPDTFLCDTPGFSALALQDMEKEELRSYFPELAPFEGRCRFLGCTHTREPGCLVQERVEAGEISPVRYESYLSMYEELKNRRRY